MHHDLFWLFNRYWWLIFPLFWMVMRIVRISLNHSHANRTLDILKSYAEQGKDPPAEVLAALKDRRDLDERRGRRPDHGWGRFFLFAALAVAFAAVAYFPNDMSQDHDFAFVFVAIIMVGLALGSLVSALTGAAVPPQDKLQ